MTTISLHQQTQSLAQRLARLQPGMDETLARLSSGTKLTRPSADPIGVGVAARYDARQRRYDAAAVNLQNGASRLQTTDSALAGMARTLERLSELATLTGNAVQSPADREVYNREFVALQEQLRSMIGGTTADIGGTSDVTSPQGSYEGRALFGAPPAGGEFLAAGAEGDEQIALPDANLRQGPMLAIFQQDGTGAFTLQIDAPGTVAAIKAATDQIATKRAAVGGAQSRIEFASSAIATAQTNAEAALSRIRDTDVASESTTLARRQMLEQSHVAMLTQAREVPRHLLPLLSNR